MCACFDILYLKEFFIDQDIDGKDVPLKKFKNKVLLIVNVASQCGLTTVNYTELSHIYEKYKTQGTVFYITLRIY